MMLHRNLIILYLSIVWLVLAASENAERMQAEWVEIANDLTPTECGWFLTALRVVSYELPKDMFESSADMTGIESPEDCLSLLRAWRRGDGQRMDWPHILLRLRQINRPDVADRISDEVAEVQKNDVNKLFLSNPFHDMIKHHRSTFLVEHADDRTPPNGQREAMGARSKRHLHWRVKPLHTGHHAIKILPQEENAKSQRKKDGESAWLVAMVAVPCAVVAMTTVLLGILWAYMYWKHGKHFRLRWLFRLTKNDMKLYSRERRLRKVSGKTSRNELFRTKQDPISEPLSLGAWRENQVYPGCITVQAELDKTSDGSIDVGIIQPVTIATDTLTLFRENDSVTRPKRKRSKVSVIRDETRPSERPVIPALHLSPENDGNESGAWTCPTHDVMDECPICQYLVTSVNVTDSLSSLSPSPSESSLVSLTNMHPVAV
ncbi:uncharacterized protein LOC144881971 isoform X1 [Branchiostoma floridae x Branchiostoma japonicum]